MKYLFAATAIVAFLACSASIGTNEIQASENLKRMLSDEAMAYWYQGGGAEITSYQLKQARYGEIREGEAVTVFVTEPFSPSANTKADNPGKENVSVLKLNFSKRFNTGIYPYSMMNSTFYPMQMGEASLKASTSVQEWCGHVYMELQNKKQFDLINHSYFEGESFEKSMAKAEIEDDYWSKIRLHPETIKDGTRQIIPSFFFMRLMHVEAKSYRCDVKVDRSSTSMHELELNYPELNRTLRIQYEAKFPHAILSWTELYIDGFGDKTQLLETTGKRLKTLRSKYWEKNANSDSGMRAELGLKM
jgi:hypothetical protein